jgi:GNAT superfamily N-acetyltransferase
VPDGPDARRLAPELVMLGYRSERLLTMVQDREPEAWTDGPAQEVGAEIVAIAELYVLGGVGQVEAVYTLEAYRGRGFGRVVVLAASKAARDRGADLVFLDADDEDWPKVLYGKLGFEELRRFWSFVKSPD